MNILKILAANNSAVVNQSLYDIIAGLGLTTNLKLCLDAGDSSSYNPATQTNKWFDTSGGGYDFFRGTGAGGDAADPTFNGTAGGLSSSEFWSFDGGDYFTYDTTNEVWMNNLHKNNATYTLFFAFEYPSASNAALFSTRGVNQGINFRRNGVNQLSIDVYNDASAINLLTSTTNTTLTGWNIGAVSINEAAGTGVFMLNGSTETFTSTYAGTVSASNVSNAVKIATRATAAALTAVNGSKMSCFGAWEATALTSTNLTDIYNALKGRFGL